MSNKKILIVDDEMSIHASLEFILKQYDVEILHAIDATEAIPILKETKPDLIFMDFKLPGINGIILTQKIKSLPAYQHIPVIGITAYASEENKQIAKGSGLDIILEKPFDLTELQKLINQFIS